MIQLEPTGITQSRLGYLFAYAQISFNQFRRYANLQLEAEKHDKEREALRARISGGDIPPREELAPKGWRSFTLQFELEAEQLECRILAVVAAALFLEAYIFDYCARRESATFAKKYIDRLDPVAKWIIVPRLVAPPGLDPGSNVFERLHKLFKLRNELVHHKTKSGENASAPPELPPDMLPGDCLRVVWDVLQALQDRDPGDEFGAFVVRHIASWARASGNDREFYPILWEA